MEHIKEWLFNIRIKLSDYNIVEIVIVGIFTIILLTMLIGSIVIGINGSELLTRVNGKSIYTFEDLETGVWYLYSNDTGITPRLNADGTLYEEE